MLLIASKILYSSHSYFPPSQSPVEDLPRSVPWRPWLVARLRAQLAGTDPQSSLESMGSVVPAAVPHRTEEPLPQGRWPDPETQDVCGQIGNKGITRSPSMASPVPHRLIHWVNPISPPSCRRDADTAGGVSARRQYSDRDWVEKKGRENGRHENAATSPLA